MAADVSTTGNSNAANTSSGMKSTSSRVLTLIVAATRDLGIGRDGGLPWPQLKQEMGYFARITKRPSSSHSQNTVNAVVMGRKTWDSIPPKFRPLKGRLNLVVSRSMTSEKSDAGPDGPIVVSGIQQAMNVLDERSKSTSENAQSIGDVFIIGGSSIYDSALSLPQTKRVLLTKIKHPQYECDTFFPLDLDGEEAKEQGWRRKSWHHLVEFAGGEEAVGGKEVVAHEGHVKEGIVEWEYCLYER